MSVLCDVIVKCPDCDWEVVVLGGEVLPDSCPCGCDDLEVIDSQEPSQDGWSSDDCDWDW